MTPKNFIWNGLLTDPGTVNTVTAVHPSPTIDADGAGHFWLPASTDALLAAALQANARASWRDLAELADTSESTAARRVRALVASGAVRSTVIADPIRCGLGLPVTVLFRVNNKSLRPLRDHLIQREDVRLVALLTGRFSLLADFIVPSLDRLAELMTEDLTAIDATFESVTHPTFREFKTTVDWAVGLVAGIPGVRTPLADIEPAPTPIPLDKHDEALVAALRTDGRMSFSEAGQPAGLSESAARRRFDALVQSGRVHPVTLVDSGLLGFHAEAFIWLNTEPGAVDQVAHALAARPEIRYLAVVGTDSDLFCEVVLPKPSDLLKFRTDVLGALDGVTAVEVAMNVRTLKRAFLPTRVERARDDNKDFGARRGVIDQQEAVRVSKN